MAVPLLVHGQLRGMIITETAAVFGPFTSTDLDLLAAFANQAAVAIENTQLVEGREQTVSERTAELRQRVNELAVINSIQEGVAAELNFQAINNLVGDKLCEVFKNGDIGIRWYDPQADLIHYLYEFEHGERLNIPSRSPKESPLWLRMLETRQPLVFNAREDYITLGTNLVPGTDQSQSLLSVPLRRGTGGRACGPICLPCGSTFHRPGLHRRRYCRGRLGRRGGGRPLKSRSRSVAR